MTSHPLDNVSGSVKFHHDTNGDLIVIYELVNRKRPFDDAESEWWTTVINNPGPLDAKGVRDSVAGLLQDPPI